MALMTPVLSFVAAIDFKRVSVVPVPAAAATDAAVTETANAAGAAVTASAAIAEARPVTVNATPRRLRTPRSLSSARLTRFCAASSLMPRAEPTARKS